MRILPLATALLAACNPWVDPDDTTYTWGDLRPWTPENTVSDGASVYVTLDRAGDGVALRPDGPERLDFGDYAVQRFDVSPDGGTVLARTLGVRCDTFDDVEVETVDDCPSGDKVTLGRVEIVAPAGAEATFAAGPWFGAFTFSDDGRFAVAAVQPDASTKGGGLVNLTSVLVLDLSQGERWEVSVGFQANRILFTTDATGAATGMLVLSRSEVALVDLTSQVPTPGATYPLTLDPDATVDPIGVALTPDQAHALISIRDSSDLYVLDLVDPSINILSLVDDPSDMAVDAARDQSLLVYAGRAFLEVVDHRLFDVTRLPLDEPASRIAMGPDFAILWGPATKDVVRVDLETLRIDEYRLDWNPREVTVAPDFSFALVLSDDSGGRLEVLSLLPANDGRLDRDPKPFGLEGRPLSATFASDGTETRALLLQEGVDTLYELRWPSLQVDSVALPSPPARLGSLDDGTFWIAHVDPLGLLSFLDADGTLQTLSGFAATGMFDDRRVVTEEE